VREIADLREGGRVAMEIGTSKHRAVQSQHPAWRRAASRGLPTENHEAAVSLYVAHCNLCPAYTRRTGLPRQWRSGSRITIGRLAICWTLLAVAPGRRLTPRQIVAGSLG
jgi:hypothetical protein